MTVGTVKEIKIHEYRVGLTPYGAAALVQHGHDVLVQKTAGEGAGYPDSEYLAAGALLVDTAEEVFGRSEMIIKVKEPQPPEISFLRPGQILYTFFHLAADRKLTEDLLASRVYAVAYETMETGDGQLPCLKPMSEIAGRLSVQQGAKYLEKEFGGRGVLLGGVPGVERGRVAILGGGIVGTNAAQMAMGLGARVSILDINPGRLEYLSDLYFGRLDTLYSNAENIERVLGESDLIIGAVLVHGARAPQLVRHQDLARMKKGSVLVDVAIDQGGCFETSKPTTHADPVYTVDDVLHYCVTNMPGAVSRTATQALTAVTLPYALKIADQGLRDAAKSDPVIMKGINIFQGNCSCKAVADTFRIECTNFG